MPERTPTAARHPPVNAPTPRAPGPTQRRRLAPAAGVRAISLPGGGPGAPLLPSVATQISASLGVDVSPIRLHSDPAAAARSHALGARAFTLGNHIFLGAGERATDVPLIAHEVAHVVQQQAGPRVQLWTTAGTDAYEREAHRASAAVGRRQSFAVRERTGPRLQRLGISDALDYFADKANWIPGFRMFTIILGVNPINMSRVERSAANILRAIIEFLPGGALITQALDKYGVFDKVGTWVEKQFDTLGLTWSSIRAAIDQFLDSLSWRDIFHLGDVWDRAKQIFTTPIQRIKDFVVGLVEGIITFVRDAILQPLAHLAEGTRGWDLLIAVLGRNPITGESVPRNAETLIGGFLKLIGQQDVWENMKRANALGRAWAWFEGALNSLVGFVSQIPGLFISALRSLEWTDIVLLPRAFAKVGAVFGSFLGRFISWAGNAVWNLLEIIFDVVSPTALRYIKRTGAALRSILRNPLPFMGNLIRAAKQGFLKFAANFLDHLKDGLIDWLTGSLPGVYIPKALTLAEVVRFVFSVLGISWQNVRQKLVRLIPEPVVKVLETTFGFVVKLVTEGPAAAWEQIKESLSGFTEMAIGAVTDFITDTVVTKAIPQLISLFIPGAGFITAIIKIYDTVMVFVQKISRIIQVVTAFVDSIVQIAAGDISGAVAKVESVLAGLLSLAINFLAGFVGLGRVADKITGALRRVWATIDKALDKLVEWIVGSARRVGALAGGAVRAGGGRLADWWRARKTFTAPDRTEHSLFFRGEGSAAELTVASTPTPVNAFLRGISGAAAASSDPGIRTNYQAATALARQIDGLRMTVESGPEARRPSDVDLLNQKMIELGRLLGPLIPLAYPTAGPAGSGTSVPVAEGDLIKVTRTNQIALISQITQTMVNFKFVRPGVRHVTAEGRAATAFKAAFGTEYTKYVDDPRELYLGPTPRQSSGVGARVIARMANEGKYRPDRGGEIAYGRNLQGRPLLAGATVRWVSTHDCDMGHVIDAVAWWNSNGRLTGPQSPDVLRFMNDPINYELEPSAENRLRGARIGARYLPPAI